MSSTLVNNAVDLARLMEVTATLGGTASITPKGVVMMTTKAGEPACQIGRTIKEAVASLEALPKRSPRMADAASS